jgi:hypothetical protein
MLLINGRIIPFLLGYFDMLRIPINIQAADAVQLIGIWEWFSNIDLINTGSCSGIQLDYDPNDGAKSL